MQFPMKTIAGGLAVGLLFAVPVAAQDQDQVARGKYVATAADCIACHTAPGGKPFAGGLPFKTPMGTIYAPNITPDRQPGSATGRTRSFFAPCMTGSGRMENGCTRLFHTPPFPVSATRTHWR